MAPIMPIDPILIPFHGSNPVFSMHSSSQLPISSRPTLSPACLLATAWMSLCTLPLAAQATDWPLPRGDAQATGYTATELPANLTVRWEFKADEAIEATPVVAHGKLFIGDASGQVYALNQADGKEVWRRKYETLFLAAAAVDQDLLVIGDVDGNVYALDVKSGQQRWQAKTEGEIYGSPAFHQDKVLIASQDGKLYCFAAQNGSLVWTYQTNDQVRCSPTIAGNRTFLGGCDEQLHVVDLNTGKAATEPLPLDGPTGSTPSILADQAFLPIMNGVVLAFDWKQGTELWRWQDQQRDQEYRSSAAVTKDRVVVSSEFKQIDALSAKTGKHLWRHTLRKRAEASPVIAGQDVWIASTDGRLIRLSLEDGTERWQYEIRGAFLAAPAIAGNELFIADDEGVVRCFGQAAQ